MAIKINPSFTEEKARKLLILISCALVCTIIALMICLISSANYITIDAVVADRYSVLTSLSGNTRSSIVKSVVYNYTVDGTEYTVEQQVLLFTGYDIGSVHSVRYNPQDASQLSNTYLMSVLILAAAILSVFCCILRYAYQTLKIAATQ